VVGVVEVIYQVLHMMVNQEVLEVAVEFQHHLVEVDQEVQETHQIHHQVKVIMVELEIMLQVVFGAVEVVEVLLLLVVMQYLVEQVVRVVMAQLLQLQEVQ
jgi:hypothetical protein